MGGSPLPDIGPAAQRFLAARGRYTAEQAAFADNHNDDREDFSRAERRVLDTWRDYRAAERRLLDAMAIRGLRLATAEGFTFVAVDHLEFPETDSEGLGPRDRWEIVAISHSGGTSRVVFRSRPPETLPPPNVDRD